MMTIVIDPQAIEDTADRFWQKIRGVEPLTVGVLAYLYLLAQQGVILLPSTVVQLLDAFFTDSADLGEVARRLGLPVPGQPTDPKDVEIVRLRGLLREAADYVERYGDHRKDADYERRFRAAAEGRPEPEDPYHEEES